MENLSNTNTPHAEAIGAPAGENRPHDVAHLFALINDGAASERTRRCRPFFAWVIKTRHDTEARIHSLRNILREGAHLVSDALSDVQAATFTTAPTRFPGLNERPATLAVSPLVVDYARMSVELVESENDFAQLNSIYPAVFGGELEELAFDPRDAPTVQALWRRYQDELCQTLLKPDAAEGLEIEVDLSEAAEATYQGEEGQAKGEGQGAP